MSTPSTSKSFYRRPIPPQCVPFASVEGKQLFKEALAAGGMEGYFSLAEQFTTQNEPAYCGPGTLAMVLNALNIDPGRLWKGPWRWYSEELLDCCKPLDSIKTTGLTLSEFVCLAQCNGSHAEVYLAQHGTCEQFRGHVKDVCSTMRTPGLDEAHMVVSFSRRVLGQTGDGHFSPIAGYHAERDMVLVLDVARFKYPPYWVSLPLLWESLLPLDSATNISRGYCLLSKSQTLPPVVFRIVSQGCDDCDFEGLKGFVENTLPLLLKEPGGSEKVSGDHQPSAGRWEAFCERWIDALPECFERIGQSASTFGTSMAAEHSAYVGKVLDQLRSSQLYSQMQQTKAAQRLQAMPASNEKEKELEVYAKEVEVSPSQGSVQFWVERPLAATLLLYVLPDQTLEQLDPSVQEMLQGLRNPAMLPTETSRELFQLRNQFETFLFATNTNGCGGECTHNRAAVP